MPMRIDHVPFEKSAIATSLEKLLATDVKLSPDFESGYRHWKSDKNAGIFSISISKAIILMMQSVYRGRA
jgi:hypothetical protein